MFLYHKVNTSKKYTCSGDHFVSSPDASCETGNLRVNVLEFMIINKIRHLRVIAVLYIQNQTANEVYSYFFNNLLK